MQYLFFNVYLICIFTSIIEPMSLNRHCDRFIPTRPSKEFPFDICYSAAKETEASTNYSRILSPQSTKYLKFTTPRFSKNQTLTDFIFKSLNKKDKLVKKTQSITASRILDAPQIINNFYHNPLDWSMSNMIGIALSQSAYILSSRKEVQELQRMSNIPITCLKFFDGDKLCLLGESTGRIDIYDNQKKQRVRQLNVHYDRVGVLQNSDCQYAFFSGSKDKIIKFNDIRIKKTDVFSLQKHKGEVCGLSVAKTYLASGGNDNKVIIWDIRKSKPINQIKQHKSAVKAVAWCPWKTSLLATGGGSHDKKILLWNGNKNIVQSRLEASSQVVALEWRQEERQLISGHYSGKNSYSIIWQGLNPYLKLRGHQGRLLGMKLNPRGENQLCTVASDQTMRFWDIGKKQQKTEQANKKDRRLEGLLQSQFR